MRNILEHGWIERLDRRKVIDKGLEDLCQVLHEEAEKKYPKHKRRINLLKMKKHQNETNIAFLRRVRKNLGLCFMDPNGTRKTSAQILILKSLF